MANRGGFAGALASGIMGYIKGTQMERDNQRDDDERKAREEDRAYTRDQRAQATDEKRQLATAARPVDVQQGAGGVTLPASADNRDVGQPDGPSIDNGQLQAGYRVGSTPYATQDAANAAVADYNTPEAAGARQVSVLRSLGKPVEAQQLETSQVQGKAAKATLDHEQQKWVDEKFDQRLSEVSNAADLAQHMTAVTGKPLTVVKSADGKKAQLVFTNDQGEQVKYGGEFEDTPAGINRAITPYTKSLGAAQKITALQHFTEFDEKKAQDEWTRKHGDATLASQDRHQTVMEGQGAAHLALQGRTVSLAEQAHAESLKNDPLRNLPGGTKLVAAQVGKQLDNYDKAIAQSMAQGQWDPTSKSAMDLLDKRDAAQRQLNGIMKPYMVTPGAATPGATTGAAGGGAGAARDIVLGGQKPAPGAGSAPAAGAQPGSVMAAAGQPAPQAVSAAPAQPAPAIPGAQAAPARDPLLAALNPSGNASIDAAMAPKAAALRPLVDAAQQAQDKVTEVARTAPGMTGQAIQQANAAREAVREAVMQMAKAEGMNSAQAETMVRQLNGGM